MNAAIANWRAWLNEEIKVHRYELYFLRVLFVLAFVRSILEFIGKITGKLP